MEKQMNKKIIEIVHQVNDMIPVEWDDLYISIELDRTLSGGIYFFFKSLNEYQYFLDIPSLYSLSSEVFDKEYDILFEKAQELKKIFLENDQADWYICIIHLDESNKLSVDFDYAPWLESGYGPSSRMDLFEYKYLGKQPANEKELEKFKAMEAFQREHNQKQSKLDYILKNAIFEYCCYREMEDKMLEKFVKVADMPKDVIEKYKNQVPAELLQIWQEDGLGTFLDGYLKVINPDDYLELLQDSYFRGDVAFPMFVTAFGDIITWEESAYVGIVQYNIQDLDIMIKRMDRFIEYVDDEDFKDDYFDIPLYKKAVAKHGLLAYDECFGFVPLLALGGFKDVDHMDKVKVLEHIYLMYQLTGGVMDDQELLFLF